VAQYADGCNLFARLGDAGLQHKLDVLQQHCAAVGRPYSAIEKTTLGGIRVSRDGGAGIMSPDQVVEYFAALAALGIDQGIVSLENVAEPDAFDVWATDIVPAVSKLAVAGR